MTRDLYESSFEVKTTEITQTQNTKHKTQNTKHKTQNTKQRNNDTHKDINTKQKRDKTKEVGIIQKTNNNKSIILHLLYSNHNSSTPGASLLTSHPYMWGSFLLFLFPLLLIILLFRLLLLHLHLQHLHLHLQHLLLHFLPRLSDVLISKQRRSFSG